MTSLFAPPSIVSKHYLWWARLYSMSKSDFLKNRVLARKQKGKFFMLACQFLTAGKFQG
jgi:hypothetical protein